MRIVVVMSGLIIISFKGVTRKYAHLCVIWALPNKSTLA